MKVRCKSCDQYTDRDTAIRIGLSSFCSDDCRQEETDKRKRRGAARLTTERRKTISSSAKKRTAKSLAPQLRQQVFEADRRRCRLCGVSEGRAVLHAHHVVYRSEGGPDALENLLTLCLECHDTVHSRKRYYQPLAKRIIALRGIDDQILIPLIAGCSDRESG